MTDPSSCGVQFSTHPLQELIVVVSPHFAHLQFIHLTPYQPLCGLLLDCVGFCVRGRKHVTLAGCEICRLCGLVRKRASPLWTDVALGKNFKGFTEIGDGWVSESKTNPTPTRGREPVDCRYPHPRLGQAYHRLRLFRCVQDVGGGRDWVGKGLQGRNGQQKWAKDKAVGKSGLLEVCLEGTTGLGDLDPHPARFWTNSSEKGTLTTPTHNQKGVPRNKGHAHAHAQPPTYPANQKDAEESSHKPRKKRGKSRPKLNFSPYEPPHPHGRAPEELGGPQL